MEKQVERDMKRPRTGRTTSVIRGKRSRLGEAHWEGRGVGVTMRRGSAGKR